MSEPSVEVTRLLQDWSQGDSAALERIMPLVFEDLRQMARHFFGRESPGHTLQPTALVSELFLKLHGQERIQWQNREQFFAVAGLLMRRILVDYAKGRQTKKRGDGVVKIPLEKALHVAEAQNLDIVALDEALSRLGEIDPRQSRIVELRFFTGLQQEEIAELLDISVTTVKREWRTARLWLHRELSRR
ncbi:MAG: sigma-70 family RNA polymerase sigma factor [Acidobacteriota bacterium]